jgi:hypothetical protein
MIETNVLHIIALQRVAGKLECFLASLPLSRGSVRMNNRRNRAFDLNGTAQIS